MESAMEHRGFVPTAGDALTLNYWVNTGTLSPPLYPDTSIYQGPLCAGTPNLIVELGLNEVQWANGIFVENNSISATYTSASVSPVPLPAAWLLLSGMTRIAVFRKRKSRTAQ
jgi:hypothetical protein